MNKTSHVQYVHNSEHGDLDTWSKVNRDFGLPPTREYHEPTTSPNLKKKLEMDNIPEVLVLLHSWKQLTDKCSMEQRPGASSKVPQRKGSRCLQNN